MSNHEVVQHGHALKQPDILEGSTEPSTRYLVPRHADHRSVFKTHLPAIGRQHPADDIQQCRFAGTIRSNDCMHALTANSEVDLIQRDQTTELLSDSTQGQDRLLACAMSRPV